MREESGVGCSRGEGYDDCMSSVIVGHVVVSRWGRGVAAMRHDRKEVTAIIIIMMKMMMMAVPMSSVPPLLRESSDWCPSLFCEYHVPHSASEQPSKTSPIVFRSMILQMLCHALPNSR